MQQLTHAYIMGINEGRALLRATPDLDRTEMLDILDNVTSALRQGFSGDVAEMLRGERDFWENQINIKHERNGGKP